MLLKLKRWTADESGATAIEYGLICAAIAVAIMLVVQSLGTSLVAALQSLITLWPA
jgi:pilus assembly protein Flp/PilA